MKQCFRFDQRVNEDKQLRKLVQIVFWAVRASSPKKKRIFMSFLTSLAKNSVRNELDSSSFSIISVCLSGSFQFIFEIA